MYSETKKYIRTLRKIQPMYTRIVQEGANLYDSDKKDWLRVVYCDPFAELLGQIFLRMVKSMNQRFQNDFGTSVLMAPVQNDYFHTRANVAYVGNAISRGMERALHLPYGSFRTGYYITNTGYLEIQIEADERFDELTYFEITPELLQTVAKRWLNANLRLLEEKGEK